MSQLFCKGLYIKIWYSKCNLCVKIKNIVGVWNNNNNKKEPWSSTLHYFQVTNQVQCVTLSNYSIKSQYIFCVMYRSRWIIQTTRICINLSAAVIKSKRGHTQYISRPFHILIHVSNFTQIDKLIIWVKRLITSWLVVSDMFIYQCTSFSES